MFLSVDVGSALLSNPTHIRGKGVIQINQTLRERCDIVLVTAY
jgi:hypothetical protein